jgi:Fe-S cluster assembly ATP-binding protein
MSLSLRHLSISRAGNAIVSDFSLACAPGECVVIRGKNGVGKSSILSAIMGFSELEVTGEILVDDVSYSSYKTHERARAGLFLAHQEPPVIDGVSLGFMARASLEAIHGITDVPEAQRRIREALSILGLPDDFAQKTLHGDMSGGEKKRAELFQLLLLKPKYALLDELDSGLDADSCALAAKIIADLRREGTGFIIVTHSDAFQNAIEPTAVIEI